MSHKESIMSFPANAEVTCACVKENRHLTDLGSHEHMVWTGSVMSLITILECIVIQDCQIDTARQKLLEQNCFFGFFSAFSNFCLLACRTDQVDANKCYIMAQKCSCLDSDILWQKTLFRIPGIGLKLAYIGGLFRVIHSIIKKRVMSFAFEKTPSISLSCMLVPVLYWESKIMGYW